MSGPELTIRYIGKPPGAEPVSMLLEAGSSVLMLKVGDEETAVETEGLTIYELARKIAALPGWHAFIDESAEQTPEMMEAMKGLIDP